MSNPMYLSRTRFQTLDREGGVVSTSYGARIYDDIGCAYSNLLDTAEELRALNASALVEYMRETSETAKDMIDTVLALGDRFYVDDEVYAGGDGDEELEDDLAGDADVDGEAAVATTNEPLAPPRHGATDAKVDEFVRIYFAGLTLNTEVEEG